MLAAVLAVAVLAVPVHVHWEACPGYGPEVSGCYQRTTNEAWITPGPNQAFVYRHELGHAFDAQRLDDGERNAFACLPALRPVMVEDKRRCRAPWSEVEETFADVYALCALRRRPGTDAFDVGGGYEPKTARRHLNACRFIQRAAD